MVTEYGMSEKLGPVFLGSEHEVFLGKSFTQQDSSLSENVSSQIDAEVHSLVQSAYSRAESILTAHREQLDNLAALLIEREKLDAEEFELFMQGKPVPERTSVVQPVPESGENEQSEPKTEE